MSNEVKTKGNYQYLRDIFFYWRDLIAQKKIPYKNIINQKDVDFINNQIKHADRWSLADAHQLWELLRKFTEVLKMFKVDMSKIPAPKAEVLQNTNSQQATKVNNISYNGHDFVLGFQYHPKIVEFVKTIPGRKYNQENKTWTVPVLQTDYLKELQKLYPFVVGDSAARIMNGVEENLEQSYSAERIELHLPLKKNLFDFQTVGADFSIRLHRTINGDQMGLGKTPQGIATALGINDFPWIVVCPKSLRLNWKAEIEAWSDLKVMIANGKNMEKIGRCIEMGMCDLLIVNYDGLKKYFCSHFEVKHYPESGMKRTFIEMNGKEKMFKGIIIDEGHEVRNEKTAKFKLVKKVCEHMAYRLILTGTPVVNKPDDLASLLDVLGYIDQFGGRRGFGRRYSGLAKGNIGKRGNATNLEELNIKLRSLCFIRREKYQVLKELPDKIRSIKQIELSNRSEYDHAYLNLIDFLASKNASEETLAAADRAKVIVQMGVLKRLSALGKIADFVEFARNMFEQDEKLVVFVWHKEVILELRKHFPDLLEVSGDVDDETIDRYKKLFQHEPEHKLIVLTYARGYAGHTLTASSNWAALELPWNDAIAAQAEDRCIAMGQLIMTSGGYKKIENIEVGDMVYTHTGRWNKVIDTWSKLERKKAFYEIKYKGFSMPLCTTEDHLIFVFDKETNDFTWIQAMHINIFRHCLAISKPILPETLAKITLETPFGHSYKNNFNKNQSNGRVRNIKSEVALNDDLMYAFGWYLAEGWSTVSEDKGSSVCVCGNASKEVQKVDRVIDIFKTNFYTDFSKKSTYTNHSNGYQSAIHSKNLAHNFLKWFGSNSEDKKIPDFVFNSTPAQIRSFLNGYYEGDGYKRKNTQQASTASDKIAIGLVQLEAYFDNPVTLRFATWGGWNFEYAIREKVKTKTLIRGVDNYIVFPIQEIRILRKARGNERVYDLTVENDNSFCVGLATVHNCHRIGQKNTVICHYFNGKDTIDDKIYSIIESKRTMSMAATGGTEQISTFLQSELIKDLIVSKKAVAV